MLSLPDALTSPTLGLSFPTTYDFSSLEQFFHYWCPYSIVYKSSRWPGDIETTPAPQPTLSAGTMFALLSCLLTLSVSSVYGAVFKTFTPPMGWNSFNAYACNISEGKVMMNAQSLVDMGLRDLGYTLVTTDCAWNDQERENGKMKWNSSTFPSGGKALGDYLHDRALKFGMYSGAGYKQCNPYPIAGSRGRLLVLVASYFVVLIKSQTLRTSTLNPLPNGVLIPSSTTTATWQMAMNKMETAPSIRVPSTLRRCMLASAEWPAIYSTLSASGATVMMLDTGMRPTSLNLDTSNQTLGHPGSQTRGGSAVTSEMTGRVSGASRTRLWHIIAAQLLALIQTWTC